MARNPYRRYEVTEYQKEALKFLQPPEDITVSEWADKYRVLDAKTSAMPGPWRTEHTPYLKGIMDEFNNYETEEIVYVKPTQVGGTECLQNMVGSFHVRTAGNTSNSSGSRYTSPKRKG